MKIEYTAEEQMLIRIGIKQEQERIIKLLEDDKNAHAYPNEKCGCEYEQSTLDTIALIKESK